MNLMEALEIIKRPVAEDAPPLAIALACGFTPLHLQTFLHAQLRLRFPDREIKFESGLFGDLLGNLERLRLERTVAVAVVIEWSDIDARLGIRNLGGWRPADLTDVLQMAKRRLQRTLSAIQNLSQTLPCICSLPTQPFPPLFTPVTQQSGEVEMRLRELASHLGASLAQLPRVRLVSPQALDEISPLRDRFDIRAEVMSGFPYKLPHAASLAELLAKLIHNPVPKKGLITDLDDTLWSGILGEVGVENICWDLDNHALANGLYQQFLASLASAGVLIGVASKNDAEIVERAFQRTDLHLPRNCIFPLECHWSRKSESVQRILKAWNVSADAVVFIDDSPMEVDEVRNAFPAMDCRIFPKNDAPGLWTLLRNLRDSFGKSFLAEEDALRLDSIRSSAVLQQSAALSGATQDDFLRDAGAVIVFDCGRSTDARALELINKTNQFNLNGHRISEAEWAKCMSKEDSFLLTVQYEDKYGRLGKIAALAGKREQQQIHVHYWVMSCRAFSRRIEHQCLKYLFEKFETDRIVLDFQATERNQPLLEFIEQTKVGPIGTPLELTKTAYLARIPTLFHHIENITHE